MFYYQIVSSGYFTAHSSYFNLGLPDVFIDLQESSVVSYSEQLDCQEHGWFYYVF